jgi:hypothetical protein
VGSTDPDTGDRRLLPNASATRQITLSRLQVGTFSVTANATHAETDPTPSNDSASASVTVEAPADLTIDMSAVSPVTIGNQTTVTATVTNTREGPARGARVDFTVPPDLPVVAVPEGCTTSALKVSCDLGTVGAQAKVARTITVQVPNEGSYIVIGTTSWAKPDPSPVNAQILVTITGKSPIEPVDNGPPVVPAEKPQLPTPQEVPISLITKGLPSGKRCLRSRTLRFKLRRPSGVSITQADLYFGSKRVKRLTGAALRKTIVMSRAPRARYKVIVVVSLRDGGRLRGRRALKTCR